VTGRSDKAKGTWKEADQILEAIKSRDRFFITSHISLDGDAVCSELALARVLEKLGKKAWIVNEGEIPHIYDFLPDIERILRWPTMPAEKWDAVFVLDLGKWSRMGKVQEAISADGDFVIDIDHHLSTTGCGNISLIDPAMSSTGELLYEFFKYANLPVDRDMALLLYVAIITDTGRFSYDNTTVRTHRNIAELMELGVEPQYISNRVFRRNTPAQLQLFGRALGSLKVSDGGEIAWIVLRRRDFEETGTTALVTQDLVETPRSVDGVKIGIFFREMAESGKVKVSMRSNVDIDLNKFSSRYGGGGHAAAAGITFKGTIEGAIATIVPSLESELARGRNLL
jgi:phosphoesterase RecJ-like protein